MNRENEAKEDIPEGKRCCVCFPLRYGLFIWGYIKMILSAFFILVMSYALLHTCMMLGYNGNEKLWNRIYADIGITSVALTVFLTDNLLTMLFIVGAHQKNMKLLRVFYFFSVAMWVVTILLTAMAVSLSIESWLSQYMSPRSFVINLLNFSAYFVIIILQTYFLLLLKSEFIKLRSKREFKITVVNNPAEAKCTIKCEEKVAGDDTTDTEDV